MRNVLVVNVPGLHNLGGMAIVIGAINTLRTSIHDANFTFVSSHFENEYEFYNDFGHNNVELIKHIWYVESESTTKSLFMSGIHLFSLFLKCIGYRLFGARFIFDNPYASYDIVIDLNSDALNEHYGIIQPVFSLINIWLPMMVNKPVVIAASSIGTFNNVILKYFAKKIFNKTNMILAREENTKKYLYALGVDVNKIYSVGDHAFLMDPVKSERLNEIIVDENIAALGKPLVGISPSQLIHRYAFPNVKNINEKYTLYQNLMVTIIDYIIENMGASVIIIPHSIQSTEDDGIISNKIYENIKNKSHASVLRNKYTAPELKAVIGECNMFIGCRMHSTIASTSMNIPTVAIVYGHKSHGILGKSLGLDKCIVEIEKYGYDDFERELISKIEYVWKNKHSIENQLLINVPKIKGDSMKNGILINEQLDSVHTI